MSTLTFLRKLNVEKLLTLPSEVSNLSVQSPECVHNFLSVQSQGRIAPAMMSLQAGRNSLCGV